MPTNAYIDNLLARPLYSLYTGDLLNWRRSWEARFCMPYWANLWRKQPFASWLSWYVSRRMTLTGLLSLETTPARPKNPSRNLRLRRATFSNVLPNIVLCSPVAWAARAPHFTRNGRLILQENSTIMRLYLLLPYCVFFPTNHLKCAPNRVFRIHTIERCVI